jgi:hypothetical protein
LHHSDLGNLDVKAGVHLPQNTIQIRMMRSGTVLGSINIKFDRFIEMREYETRQIYPMLGPDNDLVANLDVRLQFEATVVVLAEPGSSMSFPIGYKEVHTQRGQFFPPDFSPLFLCVALSNSIRVLLTL